MNNYRRRLTEVETMNETTLQDLLDQSEKVQTASLQLQSRALKFNNKRMQQLATKLNSDASDLHTLIADLILTGDSDEGGEAMPGGDERQNLEQPQVVPGMGESAKNKYLLRKRIKEAEERIENDEPQAAEPETNAEVKIDLTEPFNKVIEGLEPEEFSEFKTSVISKLEDHIDTVENKVSAPAADEYSKTIEAMDAADTAEDFDFALNRLYDFADKNEIMVETVVKEKGKKKILTENPINDVGNVIAFGPRNKTVVAKKPINKAKLEPESKDIMRIEDMARKAKDYDHMKRLATQMAMAITDYSKAVRRARAAESENYHDVAKIFMDRADQILSQNQN